MLVISFENEATNFATGELCEERFEDLRGFGVRAAGRPFFAVLATGRVDEGRVFVVDGEAMS